MIEMIYGIHAIDAMLKTAKERFHEVFILKGRINKRMFLLIKAIKDCGITIKLVSRQYLDKKSEGAIHQGIIAYVKSAKQYQEKDLANLVAPLTDPFLLILDCITDPQNLGACIRSANAAGVNAIIIPRNRSAQLSATAKK